MSTPPREGPELPAHGSLRCPRCSATLGPDQDWCLECGAPARTRLAPTPNWQLPTVAIAAIVLLAGVLLAYAFVTLTSDDDVPAGTTPTAVQTVPAPGAVPPPVVVPPATTTAPALTAPPATATTTAPVSPVPPATTVPGQGTTPGGARTVTTPGGPATSDRDEP